MCGGTLDRQPCGRGGQGLSPRVRGNPLAGRQTVWGWGSIPACAGEPLALHQEAVMGEVYPRVCGGTIGGDHLLRHRVGLSPRVRGNPASTIANPTGGRSIPACAGEPQRATNPSTPARVYPRVCGGTRSVRRNHRYPKGLSPRVRGNPLQEIPKHPHVGSIPACAGEPASIRWNRNCAKVYPRVCGGTTPSPMIARPLMGLSPRVRGNPSGRPETRANPGSIPACAGEPRRSLRRFYEAWVYPRVCGGTAQITKASHCIENLSPRVRGNRGPRRYPIRRTGSIPACAGEPGAEQGVAQMPGVYPRVCGGTDGSGCNAAGAQGLSPRVRGNRRLIGSSTSSMRSIPACAGEPLTIVKRNLSVKVYPRVCGGTPRSNPPQRVTTRSIPACAGEPRTRR